MKGRFTKGFDEIKLKGGKRDHSGEELFVCQLGLPVHLLPLPELRKFHLGRKHLPSRSKLVKLSSTLQKHRTKKEQHFRNIWLLNSWVIGYQLWMTWQTSGGRWKSFEWSEELNNFAQQKTHQIQIPNNDRLYNWTPIQKQFLNTWSLDTLNSNTFHCVVKSLGFIKFCKAFLSDIIPIKNSFKWGCSRIFAGFKRDCSGSLLILNGIVRDLCWF